jgi:tryptophan-rich sensory protein
MTGRSFFRLIGCLGLCLSVAIASGSVTYPEIPTWYAALTKPSWTPPNWLFPLVWSVLYPTMGVTLWLLWDRAPDTASRRAAITLFLLQLVLNAAWSPVFFGLHQARAALIIIVLLAAAIAATIVAAWRAQRTAAWLLGPYFAWVVYATTLNAGIVALNDA